jgi:hypothetical protein
MAAVRGSTLLVETAGKRMRKLQDQMATARAVFEKVLGKTRQRLDAAIDQRRREELKHWDERDLNQKLRDDFDQQRHKDQKRIKELEAEKRYPGEYEWRA